MFRYHLIAKSKKFAGFDKHLMSSLKLLDVAPEGEVTYSLLIDERYTNLNGVMHGGAAGVIFDMATTTALGPFARPGYWEYAFPLFDISLVQRIMIADMYFFTASWEE